MCSECRIVINLRHHVDDSSLSDAVLEGPTGYRIYGSANPGSRVVVRLMHTWHITAASGIYGKDDDG